MGTKGTELEIIHMRINEMKKTMAVIAEEETDYAIGVYNGMETVVACLEQRDAVYYRDMKEQNIH